jgi:hypothetical protein
MPANKLVFRVETEKSHRRSVAIREEIAFNQEGGVRRIFEKLSKTVCAL